MPRWVWRLYWNTKERWRFCAATHTLARLGGMVDAASRCGNSPTASFTMSGAKSSEWSRLLITDAGPAIGAAGNKEEPYIRELRPSNCFGSAGELLVVFYAERDDEYRLISA